MTEIALDFGQGTYLSGFGNYCSANYCGMNYCDTDVYGYKSLHTEVYAVAYNVTNFRVLWEILSDGSTGGSNITCSQALDSTDNLKNDSLEKKCRFNSTSITINFDCEQSVTWDTLGILGHNLTASAVIRMSYSDNGTSYTLAYTVTTQDSTETNTYYCLSAVSESHRYWRLTITDGTNPDTPYIGRIVFGRATIFDGENFTSRLTFFAENYVEEENLNGFESAFRQRAMRNILKLNFENLSVTGGNYSELRRYIRYVKTSLRALIIPDPANPYRYSVWAKLARMPQETYVDQDGTAVYASVDCEWNEGK